MADNNRNRQDSWRQQQDWNDYGRQQRNNDEEPNYTISENRGYRDTGRYSGMSSGDGGWQSRYERQMSSNREGDFDGGYSQRSYGRQDDWESQRGGLSSGYQDFGGNYSSRSSRNLYDRGDQGMGRRDFENRENRLGAGNYDRYGDRGRYDQNRGSDYGSSYGFGGFGGTNAGSNYGRSGYNSGRSDYGRHERGHGDWGNRDYGRRDYRSYGSGDNEERSWWDRTADEVSSWFGDEDAERRRERDRQIRGMYRGKGPKNYSRSDDRIKEDINDRLSDDPFVDASDIDVTVSNGEVTLTGTVDHRSTKRRAEDIADGVSGVKNVENRLRVMQASSVYSSGDSGMGSVSGSSSSTSGTSTSPVAGSDRSRKETTYSDK